MDNTSLWTNNPKLRHDSATDSLIFSPTIFLMDSSNIFLSDFSTSCIRGTYIFYIFFNNYSNETFPPLVYRPSYILFNYYSYETFPPQGPLHYSPHILKDSSTPCLQKFISSPNRLFNNLSTENFPLLAHRTLLIYHHGDFWTTSLFRVFHKLFSYIIS